ncbi:phospholipase A1 member A [Syngnathoides biaculeatus]|uniref:phospholipase A1 member A n=1 Tax=Syngnathoides biaculeatus TaxID=300417 RepID=UPI002ADE4CB0|nr:phospholipase A1 member A [Syngnathoides biaculeatus]XP_061697136.1 phospholipase A1 member A [Syngnathoides biaculeatus]
MSRPDKSLLLLLFLVLVHTVQGSEARADECADVSNTTWLQYRQQRQQQAQSRVLYLLMTRERPGCAQAFHKMGGSAFNVMRPTKVIVHGYRALGSQPRWVLDLAEALLEVEDANVLIVDWVHGASFAYNLAVDNYKEVAVHVSVLINQLQIYGCKLESFHFIGISLGAHVAGFVGTLFEGKIGRITGLDPAGPMFKNADTFDRLDPSDAQFVDAIHTDSDYFGISIPVGHVDFFLNGGNDQTGCAQSRFASVYGYVICDHMRALYVYMSALNSSCRLSGIPCESYQNFLQGRCRHCDAFRGNCPTIGLSEKCGITSTPLPEVQKLFLLTTSQPPFCAHHIVLVLEASPLTKSAKVEVTLTTGDVNTRQQLLLQTQTRAHTTVLAHPAALCEIHSITLKNTGARFYRQNDIHLKSVCLSQIASPTHEEPLCVNNVNIRRGSPWSHDFVQVCGVF